MSLLSRIVLISSAFVLMAMSAMDTVFARDLFGQGVRAQISGSMALLTGILVILLALRPSLTWQGLVVGLTVSLLAVRLLRLTQARGAFAWDAAGWAIFFVMMGLPLVILAAAILVRRTAPATNGSRKKTGSR